MTAKRRALCMAHGESSAMAVWVIDNVSTLLLSQSLLPSSVSGIPFVQVALRYVLYLVVYWVSARMLVSGNQEGDKHGVRPEIKVQTYSLP